MGLPRFEPGVHSVMSRTLSPDLAKGPIVNINIQSFITVWTSRFTISFTGLLN